MVEYELVPERQPTHQGAPVPVYIVSKSCLVREGLITLLSMFAGLTIIGNCPGAEPGTPSQTDRPEYVLLLDGSADHEIVVACIEHWRKHRPAARIVVIEVADQEDLILDCIEAGALGYTLQGAAVTEIVTAIYAVWSGATYFSPAMTTRICARLTALRAQMVEMPGPLAVLTARELEVLRYLAANHSNQEIARLLVIEVSTVKRHVHRVLEKLKVHRRTEAARLAVEQGWFVTESSGEPALV